MKKKQASGKLEWCSPPNMPEKSPNLTQERRFFNGAKKTIQTKIPADRLFMAV
jgi:hypothetical protein